MPTRVDLPDNTFNDPTSEDEGDEGDDGVPKPAAANDDESEDSEAILLERARINADLGK